MTAQFQPVFNDDSDEKVTRYRQLNTRHLKTDFARLRTWRVNTSQLSLIAKYLHFWRRPDKMKYFGVFFHFRKSRHKKSTLLLMWLNKNNVNECDDGAGKILFHSGVSSEGRTGKFNFNENDKMMDTTFKNKFGLLSLCVRFFQPTSLNVQCAFRQPDDMRFSVYLINHIPNPPAGGKTTVDRHEWPAFCSPAHFH